MIRTEAEHKPATFPDKRAPVAPRRDHAEKRDYLLQRITPSHVLRPGAAIDWMLELHNPSFAQQRNLTSQAQVHTLPRQPVPLRIGPSLIQSKKPNQVNAQRSVSCHP